jgi:flagellar basal-body rod protein FlgF
VNVSLAQAAAAMNANARWQETISENLASSSIPGFKKQDLSFSAVEAGVMPVGSAAKHWSLPKVNPATSFTPGDYKFTDKKTDVAIDGPGFFEVQLPNGSQGFTRNGEFTVNNQGQLVTNEGYPVMGDGGAIQLDRNNSSALNISSTGEISQGAERRGKFKIVNFAHPEQLTQASGGNFVAPSSGAQPEDVAVPSLRQGYVEQSNTNTVTEMANLIGSMRAFEANQRVIQMHDDRMGRAITDLGTPS